jgi:hypothetical protein
MLVTTKELLDGLERGKLDVLKTATPEEIDASWPEAVIRGDF